MTLEETAKVLMMVRAAWLRQPADDATCAVWHAVLRDFEYRVVAKATAEFLGTPRTEPPTPGQIREHAFRVRERMRANVRALPAPPASPEQIARNKAVLREMIEKLSAAKSAALPCGNAKTEKSDG
jgi:hypothetical protein